MSVRCLFVRSFAIALFLIFNGPLFAQLPANSPYLPLASARPVWPPFYKPDPSDAKYAGMMSQGWCQPTGKRARAYYASKVLDVNGLPESSFQGVVTSVHSGWIEAADAIQSTSIALIVHADPTISLVEVRGKAAEDVLESGAFVHFVGTVDENWVVRDEIERIELTTPTGRQCEPIVPNRSQNLFGTILRRNGVKLILATPTEKPRRLTAALASHAEVSVQSRDYRLSSVGDSITAKGRIYRPAPPEPTLLFSDELEVTMSAKLRSSWSNRNGTREPTRP